MSNQSIDGFQGSQPFINDKEYQNLSLDELKLVLEYEKEKHKKKQNDIVETCHICRKEFLTEKLEIIVILLVSIEELLITVVISSVESQ